MEETMVLPVQLMNLWNGTSWTELADLNTARAGGSGLGATSTAALQVGGGPPVNLITESWDGIILDRS